MLGFHNESSPTRNEKRTMRLTLATNFEADTDNFAEITAALPSGMPALLVRIDFADEHKIEHKISHFPTEHAILSHNSIARVILAASDLIDSFFTGEDAPSAIEV